MSYIVESSALKAVSVSPSDSTDLQFPSGYNRTKGIYVGASGDLKVTMADGNAVTFVGLAAGVIHPISVIRIWSTDTTATDILAVY